MEAHCCTKHIKTPAAVYCKACGIYLCAEECERIHSNLFGKSHDVSILTEDVPKCPAHESQPLNLFCCDCFCKFLATAFLSFSFTLLMCVYFCSCTAFLCAECNSSSGEHKRHRVVPSKDLEKEFKAIIENVTTDLAKAAEDLAHTVSSLDEKATFINNAAAKVRESVHSSFEAIREAATVREKDLIALIDCRCAEITGSYSEFREKASAALSSQEEKGTLAALDKADPKDLEASAQAVREARASTEAAKKLASEWGSLSLRNVSMEFVGKEASEAALGAINSLSWIHVSNEYKAPTGLKMVHAGSTTAFLTWDTDPGALGYRVYKKDPGNTSFDSDPSWEGTTGKCLVTELRSETVYEFCVKGVYWSNSLSKPSESVEAITVKPLYPKVSALCSNMNDPVMSVRCLESLCELLLGNH